MGPWMLGTAVKCGGIAPPGCCPSRAQSRRNTGFAGSLRSKMKMWLPGCQPSPVSLPRLPTMYAMPVSHSHQLLWVPARAPGGPGFGADHGIAAGHGPNAHWASRVRHVPDLMRRVGVRPQHEDLADVGADAIAHADHLRAAVRGDRRRRHRGADRDVGDELGASRIAHVHDGRTVRLVLAS